jgi:hypothetical protein
MTTVVCCRVSFTRLLQVTKKAVLSIIGRSSIRNRESESRNNRSFYLYSMLYSTTSTSTSTGSSFCVHGTCCWFADFLQLAEHMCIQVTSALQVTQSRTDGGYCLFVVVPCPFYTTDSLRYPFYTFLCPFCSCCTGALGSPRNPMVFTRMKGIRPQAIVSVKWNSQL